MGGASSPEGSRGPGSQFRKLQGVSLRWEAVDGASADTVAAETGSKQSYVTKGVRLSANTQREHPIHARNRNSCL